MQDDQYIFANIFYLELARYLHFTQAKLVKRSTKHHHYELFLEISVVVFLCSFFFFFFLFIGFSAQLISSIK